MGVPSYFAWLVRKQANILVNKYPKKVDMLYLDLNCAIHPAVKSRPMTYQEMPKVVWEYLNNIVNLVKPGKLLYIAIDGVAPAAKMKQQRARRYKSILDKELKAKLERQYHSADQMESSDDNEPVVAGEAYQHDFNMISPGTQFMFDLNQYLLVKLREQRANGNWPFRVIFSDANVVGEGEHKILDHIRQETTDKDNIIIYGLDSDLIFLSLCNYRPGIALFREKQFFEKGDETTDQEKADEQEKTESGESIVYRYLMIDELRSALIGIMTPAKSLFQLRDERVLVPRFHNDDKLQTYQQQVNALIKRKWFKSVSDASATRRVTSMDQRLVLDYVYICFFLGNDFLPGLPGLTIRDGGLDQLLISYKLCQAHLADFLVSEDRSSINQVFLKQLFLELARIEESVFQFQTRGRHTRIASHRRKQETVAGEKLEKAIADQEYLEDKDPVKLDLGYDSDWPRLYYEKVFHLNRDFLIDTADSREFLSNPEAPIENLVWFDPRLEIIKAYLSGLQWTWAYYNGFPVTFEWFYAYEHGPLISDLVRSQFDFMKLETSHLDPTTTKPLEQLLQILPPQSSHLLPPAVARLMTDSESGLIHLFPTRVELDISFKRWRWEAHPILPTIDRELLRRVLLSNLDEVEIYNRLGTEVTI